ncbi:MAG: PD-(D/E)XK nuclease family protein [Chloroflexota bacterium]
MVKQPIPLTPTEVRVLARCPLHYHFQRQSPAPVQTPLDRQVRETIQALHAAGGPARLALADCLRQVGDSPEARSIIERYYRRLERDWPNLIAGNEAMQLKIFIAGVPLLLQATIDRLDKTSDGGILAILFRTAAGPVPSPADLRLDHGMTIYHALVASTYPLKRPVRLQEWWLASDQAVTIELSEDEYRRHLTDLREPVLALTRGEVMARPGLHCDICPFKHHGCPVYAHETDEQNGEDNFVPPAPRGKIHPRQWIFKI